MRHQATDLALAPASPAPARPAPAALGGEQPGRAAPLPPRHPDETRADRPADRGSLPHGPDRDVAAAVDAVLTEYLTLRRADARLISDRFTADVADCLIDLVRRGGKRLRPAFLWWGWRAGGGTPEHADAEAVLHAAAALELIQACALVHDDLMDDSPLRRGAPAAHVALARRHRARGLRGDAEAFGASAALLTGDLALVWAEDLWDAASPSEEARRRARPVWRAMRTEMVAGQYLDLHGQAAGAPSPSSSLRVAHLKSGLYTVERPLHLGAALAGADAHTTSALRRAGRCAGVAFQLRDDILGVFGDPARTGKPAGDDVRQGKPTHLMAVGLRLARVRGRRAARELLEHALGNPALTEGELDRVRAVLTELGARDAVERRIGGLAGDALAALEEAELDGVPARKLSALLYAVLGEPALAHRPRGGAPRDAAALSTR
ncbi:polyprenyl synthetase family protein [Streptomyces radiopugnans]|uniref:Geranylgeranyl diphosphate synthase, type I n=1 Tax=Streptomyces radiopugnans TaxID=403935 RepID=A0A1H9FLS0_9ACTN|nr:polyprenyl synthetase family protein [Streptomyces radiopugnans]SEQ38844.1 geranylgeranyl diphosphate synthase, type I [Streptomyces radiopugnans]